MNRHLSPIDDLGSADTPPSKQDFGAFSYDGDAKWAYSHFGGKNLHEAWELFHARPDIHQEAFMFMGFPAFHYYFPVIETWLYSYTLHGVDSHAWILGLALHHQFEDAAGQASAELLNRASGLVDHVLSHPSQYTDAPDEHQRITASWTQAQESLLAAQQRD